MISREEKKDIEVARKYKLRLLTVKLAAFRLFDEGYSYIALGDRIEILEALYYTTEQPSNSAKQNIVPIFYFTCAVLIITLRSKKTSKK